MQHKYNKLFATLVVALFTFIQAQAQELVNYVPNQSLFSGMVDVKQINSKVNIDELIKLPLLEKIGDKLVKELISDSSGKDSIKILDLKKYGISLTSKTWFFVNSTPDLFYGAFLFALDDELKFTGLVDKIAKSGDFGGIKNAANYKYINTKELNVVWNSKVAAFYGAAISPTFRDSIRQEMEPKTAYDYYDNYNNYAVDTVSVSNDEVVVDDNPDDENIVVDDEDTDLQDENSDYAVEDTTSTNDYLNNYTDNYVSYYDKANQKCDSIAKFWCETNASIFLQVKETCSIQQNKEFMEYISTNPDAAFVIDYGRMLDAQMGQKNYGSYGMTSMLGYYTKTIKSYYDGVRVYAKLELNTDDIQISYKMNNSKMLNTFYKDLKKKKIDAKYLKYMGSGLMGYFAVGVDVEGLGKGFGNVIKEIVPTIPEYGQIVSDAVDVIDIFIDEQAIYKMFTGDMVVALNGINPVRVPHISYDYDEDYNMTERVDTITQMQPEVLCMIGVGNDEDVKKILKLNISLKLLKLENDIYSATYESKDFPVFLRIYDGVLFISNNKSMLVQPKVYAGTNQIGKEHAKMFKNNTMVMFANTAGIASYYAKQGTEEKDLIYTKLSKTFSDVKMVNSIGKESSSGTATLQLSKTPTNSISDIFKFMNEFYIEKTKRFD